MVLNGEEANRRVLPIFNRVFAQFKSLAMIRKCNHRFAQVVIRVFDPEADTWVVRGWSRRFRSTEIFLEFVMVRLEDIAVLACGAFYLTAETI